MSFCIIAIAIGVTISFCTSDFRKAKQYELLENKILTWKRPFTNEQLDLMAYWINGRNLVTPEEHLLQIDVMVPIVEGKVDHLYPALYKLAFSDEGNAINAAGWVGRITDTSAVVLILAEYEKSHSDRREYHLAIAMANKSTPTARLTLERLSRSSDLQVSATALESLRTLEILENRVLLEKKN